MQITIDKNAIARNYFKAKRIAAQHNIECSIMVKDFYKHVGLQSLIDGAKVWVNYVGSRDRTYYNTKIYGGSPIYHKGGIILTKKEADKMEMVAVSCGKPFEGYIPVNVGDDREGLSLKSAIGLLRYGRKFNGGLFTLSRIMITCCTAQSLFKINDICARLREVGAEFISFGGSFSIVALESDHKLNVDEVRIGEYLLLGTNSVTGHDDFFAEGGVNVYLKVEHVYSDRKQFLVLGGRTHFDIENCTFMGWTPVSSYSDYTIFEYEDKAPEVGDIIHMRPGYKSLMKLLK